MKKLFIKLGTIFIIIFSLLSLVSCSNADLQSKVNEEVTAADNYVNKDTPSSTDTDKNTNTNTSVEGNIKLHFINVGQADAILIQQGQHNMMIDAGNNEDESTLKKYITSLGITGFDYVIGTHAHEDHIGSLDYIINSFNVGNIYFPKQTANTQTYKNFISAVKNKKMSLNIPKVGQTFALGEAKCTILAPYGQSYEDTNDYSIVIKIEFGNNSFLLTGDAEAKSEEEMLKGKLNLKADLLKVAHHGSESSTTQKFLSSVAPKYCVVSVGADNKYNHPSGMTMKRIKDNGIQVYRTDENGTIVATSNGSNITFNTSPGSYNGR